VRSLALVAPTLALTAACSSCGAPGDLPDAAASGPFLYQGLVWGGNLAVADGEVYFTTFNDGPTGTQHAVRAVPTTGGDVRVVWQGDSGLFGYGMAVHGGRVAWSGDFDPMGEAFFSAPAAGGDRTLLGQFNSAFVASGGVTADDNWTCAANETEILCAPAAGGAAIPVYAQSQGPGWIALRNGTLYFTTDSALQAVAPSGGAPRTIAALPSGSKRFDLDDTTAWVLSGSSLVVVPLDGSPTTTVPIASGPAHEILRGPAAIYLIVTTMDPTDGGAPSGSDAIVKMALDGSQQQILLADLHFDWSLATDGTTLFVAQCTCSSGGFVARLPL
jgi:hypothetical protein